jgi:hypothetical protein
MFKSAAKSVEVNVTVLPDQTPNYRFDSSIWQNGKLVFQNDGHDGFYVSFALQQTTPQYYFANQMNAAISAKKIVTPADECPDQLPANQYPWSQFKPVSLSKDLKTLVVHDPNAKGQECQFGFSLFVTTNEDGSGPYTKVDPIGDNQNGPVHLNALAVTVTVLVIAAVAAFVSYELGLFGG